MKIKVQVKPGSRGPESLEIAQDGTYIVKIKAKPVDGAANEGVIKFLAKELGIRASKIRINSGFTSRIKYLEIDSDS
jgi:uncharacterized protein YggU (UPF0235/DUF167 family)